MSTLAFALARRSASVATRKLATTTPKNIPYWRPRWQHENRGQFFGAEWLRRNWVHETETTVAFFAFFVIFINWYERRYVSQKANVKHQYQRMQGFCKRFQFEEHDEIFSYPRPIRQSELDDPTNKWYKFRNLMGNMNSTVSPAYDSSSNYMSNHIRFISLNWDKMDLGYNNYRQRNGPEVFDYQGALSCQ